MLLISHVLRSCRLGSCDLSLKWWISKGLHWYTNQRRCIMCYTAIVELLKGISSFHLLWNLKYLIQRSTLSYTDEDLMNSFRYKMGPWSLSLEHYNTLSLMSPEAPTAGLFENITCADNVFHCVILFWNFQKF